MAIQNIPEIYLNEQATPLDLFVYDFKMTDDVVKTKVNLGLHMFSFLQKGKKQVHFAGTSVAVNKEQSLLIKKGNCLWTELLDTEAIYYCKLLFFSDRKLNQFLEKHKRSKKSRVDEIPYFTIKNDLYIASYLNTLSSLNDTSLTSVQELLDVKFEELMLYLLHKYGIQFEQYLHSLISKEISPFRKTIESNIHSNLKLEEIAFLCNMSLSTFKRHFINEFKTSPGKWLQDKRLIRAQNMMLNDHLKPSEIYKDVGYNNLSNFSTAYKNKFGKSPKKVQTSIP